MRNFKEPPLLGAVAMLGDYRRFQADAAALLAARRLDPLESRSNLVSASSRLSITESLYRDRANPEDEDPSDATTIPVCFPSRVLHP